MTAQPPSKRGRPPGATDASLEALPAILRVLLATDGTVTETLEAWFGEPVGVTNVRMAEADGHTRREVVLAGTRSGRRFAHAESTIALGSLPPRLETYRRGIGQALRDLRLSTYREIEDSWSEISEPHALALNLAASDRLIGRRYGIWVDGRRAIEIVERFPLGLYRTS